MTDPSPHPDRFQYALARRPAPTFGEGITTRSGGEPPDYEAMAAQHRVYVETLEGLGLTPILLDPAPDYPDAHFVEDTAVVTSDLAVIARPGAEARRGETETVAPVLARYRPLRYIEPPGTLDGGDVMTLGRHVFIGESARTNRAGAEQLAATLREVGRTASIVPVGAGLHLKSGVSHIGGGLLLMTGAFADAEAFAGYDRVMVPDAEADAANALWVNGTLLMPAGFPETRKRVRDRGRPVIEVEVGEARKMDGGLSCLSIRF